MLNLWTECIGVAGLAFAGLLAGAQIPRFGRKVSLSACLASVTIIFLLAALCRLPGYSEHPLLFALAAGRAKLVLLSWVVPFGLAAAMPYLLFRWEQWIIVGLIAISIYGFGVFPFLGSAMAASRFAGMPSAYDDNGLCRQSTSFTCAPAAAATALHRLGIAASESQLAILGRSCPYIGTTDFELLRSVETAGAGQIHCRYYPAETTLELHDNQVFLAILCQNSIINHCVAVFSISDKAVILADPADGMIAMTREQFNSIWSGKGILVSR